MPNRLKYHPAYIRLRSWEYWPLQITVIPVVIFWFIQGIRAWDLAYFTAINPSIHMSGLYGTSKEEIHRLLPNHVQPKSVYLCGSDKNATAAKSAIRDLGNTYPVILKPDVGERGLNVSKIENEADLLSQIEEVNGDIILQEYINYPVETSILCYIHPITGEHDITSMCLKEFLSVTGDGRSTIEELVSHYPRAILQRNRLAAQLDFKRVPDAGEDVLLEPIGNHSRGTKFLNANHLIDQKLKDVFIGLLSKMEGIQFGRFDLRTKSIEDLREGRNFTVIEFNGVNSDPLHIYDPSYPLWRAYYDQWKQWVLLRRIAMAQKKIGVKSQPQGATFRSLLDYFDYIKASNTPLNKS